MESLEHYNNTNQTDLTKGLITIDLELESEDIKSMKFLCQDHIPFKTLERINDGIHLFKELERLGKIDTAPGDIDFLLECLCRCHRMDLIKKLGFNQVQVKTKVESSTSNFSPFRLMLFETAEEIETTDIKTVLFSLSSIIPRSKHERIESMFDVFTLLERSGELAENNVSILERMLKMLDRSDLISNVRSHTGIIPRGENTEPGYGPVDEGPNNQKTQIVLEMRNHSHGSVYNGNYEHPNESSVGNPILNQEDQYGTPGIENPEGVIDIGGHAGIQRRFQERDEIMRRIKLEDQQNDRVVPSQQTEDSHNSLNSNTEQEHPSIQHFQSTRVVGNQFPAYRTGTSKELPANHLAVRNDVVDEEQSPGDSGLTAGTVSLSDVMSPESREQPSEELSLSLTEYKLFALSEVIAKHEDWGRLASELNIEFQVLTQIMAANPIRTGQVHGLLKHWYHQMKSANGYPPSADGLLEALKRSGFIDAIQEFVRISAEPETESETGTENLTARSEGVGEENYNVSYGTENLTARSEGVGEENYNVSYGEARISTGRRDIGYMDHQGPTVQVQMSTSNSDAQVGPSLDPTMNERTRHSDRNEEALVRQMETAFIDDSIMPFYKMNARPRGVAIIINNMHFHKVRNDPNSKEMPARTGTEKDAEKLEYIWNKLGFNVVLYNDVDSTRMIQIMVETAFQDHTDYDCLVCCILTHGVLGHVYGTDGRIVRINQLTGCFASRKCTTLAGKPKMFFIQACQGREKQEGHYIETDSAPHTETSNNSQDLAADRPRELIPDEADFLLGYATVPGYVSYRSRSQGSWYINKLAQNLDKYAYQHDLLSILIKVNEEVGRATANIDNGAYKQIPAPMFTLRKRIIFR